MKGVRCLVFDVDDTLYLERDYVLSGFEAVGRWAMEELALPGLKECAWQLFRAGVRGKIFDHALEEAGVQAREELIHKLVAVYREHTPSITLLEDASQVLSLLQGNVRVGIVTDGTLASQAAKIEALELRRWADPVVCTAALGTEYGKPHPRAFQIVEDATGCSGDECLYVADNPLKDFEGPKRLGWRAVRVRRKGGFHADLPSGSDVDLELPDLRELPALYVL